MKVRIVQLLCPERHCIVATAYESSTGEALPGYELRLRAAFVAALEANALDPWCGICKSPRLAYEDRPTRFATMAEAEPFLRQNEADQLATRRYLDASKG